MSVTSTTLAGVNVWRFSGAVTDTEIKTAWSSLIVSGKYQPGRYIYLDSTCDMRNVRGTIFVDCEAYGFIMHSSRNKTITALNNWVIVQSVGLAQGTRFNFFRATDGTSILDGFADGISMNGGAFIFDVAASSVNETRFAVLSGTTLTSTVHAANELIPSLSVSGVWKRVNLQKVGAFPLTDSIIFVLYGCSLNTESASGTSLINAYGSSMCYVSCTIRRAGAPVTGLLGNTYGSTGSQVLMFLNNYTDESWFGASKTNLSFANWNAGNRVIGGVLKKIQTQPSTLINVYDSRSTTAPQKSTFSESTSDFLSGTTGTTTDASTGKATFVVVGAIATGASVAITRYTGQQYTLQKFGYQVMVQSVDMTTGDDDLSAFTPVTMTALSYITRAQSVINSATTIDNLDQLAEELHNFSLTQVGATSYNALFSGNFHQVSGDVLDLGSANVNIDSTLGSKLAYNSASNTFSIKPSSVFQKGSLIAKLKTTGTVTVVTEATNLSLIGNVTQATPTNLSGVSITGNLTYNTNTDITVTLMNSSISGTISNSGTGNVKLNLVNSTVNTGTRVTAQYPITITDANGANFSSQIWVFNSASNIVEDTGFNSLVASKTVYMPVGGSIRVYSQAYGTQSKITNTNATNASLVITHIPETLVDTSLPTITRNTVAGYFSSVVENSLLYVEVDTDLDGYTPAEVLNAMHYFIVSNGGNFAALSLLANTVGSVKLIDGGFRVYSAFFKGRAKSNLNATNTPSLYITLPLYIEDASGVAGNQVMVRNANGIDVHAALWSKATANISQNDINSIAATTWSHNKRTLNDAIFE